MRSFIVISASADGISVDPMDEATLLSRLDEDYWGSDVKIVDQIPQDTDPNYWGEVIAIFEAKLVVPKPKETVTRWEV